MPAPHILIVEDNVDLARAMTTMLQLAGFDAGYALTRESSLQAIDARTPDLLILDLNLASSNGLDLLQELRGSDRLTDARVVIFTAIDDPALRDRARHLGACDYVIKGNLDSQFLASLARRHLPRSSTATAG